MVPLGSCRGGCVCWDAAIPAPRVPNAVNQDRVGCKTNRRLQRKTSRHATPRSICICQAWWFSLLTGACQFVLGLSLLKATLVLPRYLEEGFVAEASRLCSDVCVSACLAPSVVPRPRAEQQTSPGLGCSPPRAPSSLFAGRAPGR